MLVVAAFSLRSLASGSLGDGELSLGGSVGGGGGIRDMMCSDRDAGICFDDSSLVEGIR